MLFSKSIALTAFCWPASLVNATAQTALPEAIAAPGETAILTLHAEGAQVYECKTSADGALAWAFREPIATLLSDGKTVGRHYAGPTWEYTDGSAVVGQVLGTAPGQVAMDIPWLKLGVTSGAAAVFSVRRRQCNGSTRWVESLMAPATSQAPTRASPTRPITCSCARADTTLPSGGFGQPSSRRLA